MALRIGPRNRKEFGVSASHGPIRARISASILAAAIAAVFALLLGGLAPAPAGAAVGEFQPLAESETELTSMAVDPTTNLIYAQENQGRRFFAYDPRTDKWTELAEAPIDSGNNGGATYLNGKIYTVYTNNDEEMGVYDIAKDEWTVISNPLEQGTGNITAVGDELYLAV